jgi:hypothetical protein
LEDEEASQSLGGSYRLATFDSGFVVDPARFQEPGYSVNIRAMIQHVIETEAPLRDDLLVERIARAHGFRRSGRAIRERVMTLVRGTAHLEVEEAGTTFVWPDANAAEVWSEARYPATDNDIRSIDDIPSRELVAALRSCASGDREGEASRAFGLRRLSASARERLRRAIPADGHMAG